MSGAAAGGAPSGAASDAAGAHATRARQWPLQQPQHQQHDPPHARGERVVDPYVVTGLYAGMGVFQALIIWLGYARPRLADALGFAAIVLIPTAFAVHLQAWRFLGLFCAFATYLLLTFRLLRVGLRELLRWGRHREPPHRMDADAPRFVYRHFLLAHYAAVGISLAGLATLFASFAVLARHDPADARKAWLTDAQRDEARAYARLEFSMLWSGVTMCMEGAYFGLVHRDFARLLHAIISASSVVAKARNSKRLGNCALCGHALVEGAREGDWTAVEAGQADAAARGPASSATRATGGAAQLACGHVMHAHCLRGWSVIGKRNVSPCCDEPGPLPLNALGASPWLGATSAWVDVTEQIRFAVYYFSPLLAGMWMQHKI